MIPLFAKIKWVKCELKRSKMILMVLAFIAAIIAYMLAPPNAQLGTYSATLSFPNPTNYPQIEKVSFTFILSDKETVEWEQYAFRFDDFNVTVYAKESYALAPGSAIEIRVKMVWGNNSIIKITSSLMVITIKGNKDFSVDVRPSKIEDGTYVFRYTPLVKSKEAFAILVLIGFLWFTETITLSSSALLVPILAVVFHILDPKTALSPFSILL